MLVDIKELQDQSGIGPWLNDQKTKKTQKQDSDCRVKSYKLYKESIPVIPPAPSYLFTNRYFYESPALALFYFGQKYSYDLFASRDQLLNSFYNPFEGIAVLNPYQQRWLSDYIKSQVEERAKEARKLDTKNLAHNIKPDMLEFDLYRMRMTALSGDKDTMEAITVLHNIARVGGRIAYVASHGGRYNSRAHLQLFVELAETSRLPIPIDKVIGDLASRRNQGVNLYQAIYFSACNEHNLRVRTDKSPIPIIIHTAINSCKNAPAKVHWPSRV